MTVINGRIVARLGGRCADSVDNRSSLPPSQARPSDLTRGACPSLASPMVTGDGLLVRFRPATSSLSIPQFRSLAAMAEVHGNGLIEITARGNFQLRGLRQETLSGLAADMNRAGIIPETGVAIETPPLSGVDPLEISDARDMAARLRETIARMVPPPVLAPKLAIIVDGGGTIVLDSLSADIRLRAIRRTDTELMWLLSAGGTHQSARRLAALSAEEAPSAVMQLLQSLAQLGPQARGRDLHVGYFAEFPTFKGDEPPAETAAVSPVGVHGLGDNTALGLRLSFGQICSSDLIGFLAVAEEQGAKEIRTAPGHAMLVLGLPGSAVDLVKLAAANSGLTTSDDDPKNYVDACAGSGACGSGLYPTKATAAQVLHEISSFLDESIRFHLSGCPKGCARAERAAITLVGAPAGYGLVVNGAASDAPITYIRRNDLRPALRAISQLVHDRKRSGESVAACLTRLDKGEIAKALRQG